MKAIAVVTMTFLPATFVSVRLPTGPYNMVLVLSYCFSKSVFSMSFFHFDPSEPGYGFSVSNAFWVYWVLAVPLSLLTLGIWVYWEGKIVKRASKPLISA